MLQIDKDIAQEAVTWILEADIKTVSGVLLSTAQNVFIGSTLLSALTCPHVLTGVALLYKMIQLQEERNKTKELSELFKLEDKRV